MACHSYVLSKFFAGSNEHDLGLEIRQEKNPDGSYEIDSPKNFIADRIYSALELTIHEAYSWKSIRQLLETDGRYGLVVADDKKESVTQVILSVDNANGIYSYDSFGNYMCRRIYEIQHIDDSVKGYFVFDQIINPEDDCEMIAHCYHKYFLNQTDAENYLKFEMRDYAIERGSPDSGFRLIVVDASRLEELDWYKQSLDIADDMSRYGLKRGDYKYIRDLDTVKQAVKADAYDDLPFQEQVEANKYLCRLMLPFIDDYRFDSFNSDIDTIRDNEAEGAADDMILFALLSADSEEKFQAVHDALGPYGYRVGALTDSLYNSHPNEGAILMCSDGNMRWYRTYYYLNEWQGAKDNPYFGKFQLNEANDLLCLREYHPELVVSTFPDADLMQQYEMKYESFLADERRKHTEMRIIDDDDTKLTVCVGDWYPDGVYSTGFVPNTMFEINYGSSVFTTNQCKDLLSGEEIVVENYVSKAGITLSIRGKLKQAFDGPYDMSFVRTDINTRQRNIMNAVLGVVEAGLPPEES